MTNRKSFRFSQRYYCTVVGCVWPVRRGGARGKLGAALIRARYAEEIAKSLPAWSASKAVWGKSDCALALADIDLAVQGVEVGQRGGTEKVRDALRGLENGQELVLQVLRGGEVAELRSRVQR